MDPVVLYIPCKYLQGKAPFALDIGGSLIKLAYRPLPEKLDSYKTDADQQSQDATLGPVCIASIPIPEANSLVDFLRANADLSSLGSASSGAQPTTVYTTGVGVQMIQGQIETAFNVTLQNFVEFDCNTGAFVHLYADLGSSTAFYPVDDDLVVSGTELALGFIKYAITVSRKQEMSRADTSANPPPEAMAQIMTLDVHNTPVPVLNQALGLCLTPPQDIYPAMMVAVGSGISFNKVTSDGKFILTNLSHRSGRMFLGLGRLLVGAKSFDELISLAEKGDPQKVDTVFGDLKDVSAHTESDFYSDIPGEFVMYCFGKARDLDKDAFSREDIAAGLLSMLVMDLIQSAIGAAATEGCRTVLMCGCFVENPFVRRQMIRRGIFVNTLAKPNRKMPLLYIRHGSHLGALGAYMDVAKLPEQQQ